MSQAVMVSYRSATQSDAAAIATLHAENWRAAYRGNFRDEYLDSDVHSERRSVWDARLRHPPDNQYVCLALSNTWIVGFICVFGAHDATWGSFIDNLHVEPQMQRRGIGQELMQEVGGWLASRFATVPVYLLVWEFNPARLLYERLGGRNTGIVEVENPGGGTGRYFRFQWDRPRQLAPDKAP